jgi:hypothetical protein
MRLTPEQAASVGTASQQTLFTKHICKRGSNYTSNEIELAKSSVVLQRRMSETTNTGRHRRIMSTLNNKDFFDQNFAANAKPNEPHISLDCEEHDMSCLLNSKAGPVSTTAVRAVSVPSLIAADRASSSSSVGSSASTPDNDLSTDSDSSSTSPVASLPSTPPSDSSSPTKLELASKLSLNELFNESIITTADHDTWERSATTLIIKLAQFIVKSKISNSTIEQDFLSLCDKLANNSTTAPFHFYDAVLTAILSSQRITAENKYIIIKFIAEVTTSTNNNEILIFAFEASLEKQFSCVSAPLNQFTSVKGIQSSRFDTDFSKQLNVFTPKAARNPARSTTSQAVAIVQCSDGRYQSGSISSLDAPQPTTSQPSTQHGPG